VIRNVDFGEIQNEMARWLFQPSNMSLAFDAAHVVDSILDTMLYSLDNTDFDGLALKVGEAIGSSLVSLTIMADDVGKALVKMLASGVGGVQIDEGDMSPLGDKLVSISARAS
jgi:hypothetical protein